MFVYKQKPRLHKYTSFLYNMQAWFFIFLFSDLSVSENNIFCCRQRFQSHRSSCMQLLRTDPDFRAKPKFKSICKSGGRIDIHCCCIDLILKTQRTVIIFCNDRLGMEDLRRASTLHSWNNQQYSQNMKALSPCPTSH